MDNANVLYSLARMIVDYAIGTSLRNTTPVSMNTAAGMQNTDQIGNDNNIRFRHGRDDILNALFVDGHVGTFRTTKTNLQATPPNADDLTQFNIMLDQPCVFLADLQI